MKKLGCAEKKVDERSSARSVYVLLYAMCINFFFISMSFSFSAVKRLMKEAAELKDPTDHYHAQPLEVCFSICLQELVIRLCY